MTLEELKELKDPEYRKEVVAAEMEMALPFQIRAIMKSRHWTQADLAAKTGMKQPRISALLKPGKVRPNIETLRRLAEAFDCALLVNFAPFSKLFEWQDSFDPDTFGVPSFTMELAAGAFDGLRIDKVAPATTFHPFLATPTIGPALAVVAEYDFLSDPLIAETKPAQFTLKTSPKRHAWDAGQSPAFHTVTSSVRQYR